MGLTDNPVARLNRAVAVGEADGPRAGLAALRGSTPPCPATPPPRTYTSVTVTERPQLGSTPKPPDQRPTSLNATHLTQQAARLNAQLRG